ncbi:hypothetical protein PV328_005163 [Microctonus aethiopoides]|uniref:Phospholipid scramblase n=1 Tax=Microctonus aethiopoides TaxID=144406 RepID=A0AA39FLS6_9HYME|nr:hypothetical protein PV328_005163 [Microctonus aethiopoides]
MTSDQVGNYGQVIVQQPGRNNPSVYTRSLPPIATGGYQPRNTNCRPGLEYLIPLDKVFIDQRTEPFEVATGIQCSNRYTITNGHGQPIYVIREESGWLGRVCIGSSRSFKMSIYDQQGREALLIKRPVSFIGDRMDVYNGRTLLGSIEKIIFTCSPEFSVRDETGVEKLRIIGPVLLCGCGEYEFPVHANDGTMIGMIKKQWSGLSRELFTNADVFGVNFPLDLSIRLKALLLAATLLIDFGYFEN